MASRAQATQLCDLAALRGVITQAAAFEVAEALARERQAQTDLDAADEQVEAAGRRWRGHLASGLLPELGAAYAGQLIIRQAEAVTATGRLADAEGDRAERELDWRQARAAQHSADKVARLADRERLNRREEAILQAGADRATARWRRS